MVGRLLSITFMLVVCGVSLSQCQTVQVHTLCMDSVVNVTAGSAGIIQYTYTDTDTNCSLLLQGLAGSVFITGIQHISTCSQPTYTITINEMSYCISGAQASIKDFIINVPASSPMTVQLHSTDRQDFTLNYYSKVVQCGDNVTLTESTDIGQLSGVIVSAKDPQVMAASADCATHITISLNSDVHFIFHGALLNIIDGKITLNNESSITAEDNSSIVTAANKLIVFSYKHETLPAVFAVTFSALHCGKLPAIANAIAVTPPIPWFPGSKVTYSCVDGYQLSEMSQSSISCEIDNQKTTWRRSTEIMCIREPWCHSAPDSVANSTYKLTADNLTAVYSCIDGYTSSSTTAMRTSTCNSAQPSDDPWIWSQPIFSCSPVMCEELDISNTESHRNTQRIIGSTVVYTCKQGFARVGGDSVRTCADSDGLGIWSGSDLKCRRHLKPGFLALSIIATAALMLLLAFLIYTRRERLRSLCKEWPPTSCDFSRKSSGNATSSADAEGGEVSSGAVPADSYTPGTQQTAGAAGESDYLTMNNQPPKCTEEVYEKMSDREQISNEAASEEEAYMVPVDQTQTAGADNQAYEQLMRTNEEDQQMEEVYENVSSNL